MGADGIKFGNEKIEFTAPWGRAVTLITWPVALVLVAGSFLGSQAVKGPELARMAILILPMLILFGSLVFTVRGYVIESESIDVVRLGWVTRLPQGGLQSAEVNPDAMKGSIRIFANGGLFCFCGLFWNRRLGRYHAYVTDAKKGIVLRWADKTVVVSPGATEEFLRRLERARPGVLRASGATGSGKDRRNASAPGTRE